MPGQTDNIVFATLYSLIRADVHWNSTWPILNKALYCPWNIGAIILLSLCHTIEVAKFGPTARQYIVLLERIGHFIKSEKA